MLIEGATHLQLCSNSPPTQACTIPPYWPCSLSRLFVQLVDSLVGTLDAPVLERLAKVLSFVRISGKNGKKLKRKDKLRMLEAMEQAQLGGPSNGSVPHAANGDSAQPPLPSCALFASEQAAGFCLLDTCSGVQALEMQRGRTELQDSWHRPLCRAHRHHHHHHHCMRLFCHRSMCTSA